MPLLPTACASLLSGNERCFTSSFSHPTNTAGGRLLIKTVSSNLRALDVVIPEEEDVPGLLPYRLPVPEVHYTLTSTTVHPAYQRQLALEAVAAVTSPPPCAYHHIYRRLLAG